MKLTRRKIHSQLASAAGQNYVRCTCFFAMLLVCSAYATYAKAQDASIRIESASEQVEVGGVVEIVIEGKSTSSASLEVEVPNFAPFDVLGSQVYRPMQMQFRSGQGFQVSKSARYEFRLRAPNKVGSYSIGPAFLVEGRKKHRSNVIRIQVTNTSDNGVDDDPGSEFADSDQPVPPSRFEIDSAQYDEKAFLRTVVDKAKVYVGQQCTATVFLYVRRDLGIFQSTLSQSPSTQGFWVRDLEITEADRTVQEVGGQRYDVIPVTRFAAFPLGRGMHTIGSTAVSLEPQSGIFDFFRSRQRETIVRKSKAVNVKVLPLPATVPDNAFIGKLELKAALDTQQIAAGEAVRLTVTAEGRGNLSTLELQLPKLDFVKSPNTPQTKEELVITGSQVGGTRIYEWLLVGQKSGMHSIESIRVPVFDPQTQKLTFAKTETLALEIIGSVHDESSTGDSPTGPLKPALKIGAVVPRLETRGASEMDKKNFWQLQALPLVIFLLSLGTTSVVRRRKKRKLPRSQRIYAQCKVIEKSPDDMLLINIEKAVQQSLAIVFKQNAANLTRQEIRGLFDRSRMPSTLRDSFIDLLERVDQARYAGIPADDIGQLRSTAISLLQELGTEDRSP